MRFRQFLRLLSLVAFGLLGQACASQPQPALPPGHVKWHPGHYVTLLQERSDPGYLEEVMRELDNRPALRGVQIRYTWAELEPERGRYDFSRIERDLKTVSSGGKRLFVLLQTKSFDERRTAVPPYLAATAGSFEIEVGGGGRGGVPKGRNIALWQDDVRERYAELLRAMGARFNSHSFLEGVAFTETAIGRTQEPMGAARQQRFFENLLQVHRVGREAFPNTVTLQFVNHPRSILPWFVDELRKIGVGLGGPDVFLDEKSLIEGVYKYYPKLEGVVPLAPSVQHSNYISRRRNGPVNPPTVQQLYEFARSDLRGNYLFWTRRIYGEDRPYQNVLEFLDSTISKSDVTGGLSAVCPVIYAACVR